MPNLRRPRPAPDAPNDPAVEAAYAAAPEWMVAEIIEGELYTQPRPRPRHAATAGTLLGQLDGPLRFGVGGPGGWIILIEPEIHLGPKPDKLAPDLAGWRRERLPADVLDDDAAAALTVPPDWVCEVLSPSTERLDRTRKMRIYRRERVGHVWLVQPALQSIEVFRFKDGEGFTLVDVYEGDEPARIEPFDAIELRLDRLWAR